MLFQDEQKVNIFTTEKQGQTPETFFGRKFGLLLQSFFRIYRRGLNHSVLNQSQILITLLSCFKQIQILSLFFIPQVTTKNRAIMSLV